MKFFHYMIIPPLFVLSSPERDFDVLLQLYIHISRRRIRGVAATEAGSMEGGGVDKLNGSDSQKKKNLVQVSNTKKTLFFYVNLAKRYLQQHNEVEISALGLAIATAVSVSEILKKSGLGVQKKLSTSTVEMKDKTRDRTIQKAKIQIVLGKTQNFDQIMAVEAAERETRDKDKEKIRAESGNP